MAALLAFAGDVFDGVLFCAVLFSHKMSRLRSGTELSQFLRIFLPPLQNLIMVTCKFKYFLCKLMHFYDSLFTYIKT